MTEDEKRTLIEGWVQDLRDKGYSSDEIIDAQLDLLNEFIKYNKEKETQ